MQTVQLDIADSHLDTFLTIVRSLQKGIVHNIRIENDDLMIEPIESDSQDFIDLQVAKSENNPRYSLREAREKLGL